MERDPEIGRPDAAGETPDDIDWMSRVPGLPSTDEEVEESIRRAEEDIAAGRVYPHSLVGAWLRTWGQPDRQSFHEWLATRNG